MDKQLAIKCINLIQQAVKLSDSNLNIIQESLKRVNEETLKNNNLIQQAVELNNENLKTIGETIKMINDLIDKT